MTSSPFDPDSKTQREICRLVREIKAGYKLIDALLEHPEFKRRVLKTCRVLTRNWEDADDLFQEVCIRVALNLVDKFVPDESKDFDNLFAWVRTIARNRFYDFCGKSRMRFDDERSEDLRSLVDEGADVNFQVSCNELERHVNNLPDKERLATTRFLEGFSFREIQGELNGLGIECSHVAVRNWVRKGLKPFFTDLKVLSFKKSTRNSKARARTRAKKKAS